MTDPRRGTSSRIPLLAAGAGAVAVIVWALAVAWLPVLAILAAATALVALLRRSDWLAVAYWPSRDRGDVRAADITAAQQKTPEPGAEAPDPWL